MLRETLTGSMKDAMKAKDQVTLSTLRLVNAAIKQQDIDVRSSGNADGIADSDILSLLQKMIKQPRRTSRPEPSDYFQVLLKFDFDSHN